MTKLKPVIEQYIYEKSGIQVGVNVNYTKKEISLVEHNGTKKTWVFAERGLGYIQGWINILSIMQEAIQHAEKRLKAYEDKNLEDFAKLMYAVQKDKEEPTEQYLCPSTWEDGKLKNCTCGKCEENDFA